jgi:protein phosphatase
MNFFQRALNLFQRAFHRADKGPGQTEPSPTPGEPPAFVVDSDLLSDVGCVRTNNEDSGRILRGPGNDGASAQLLVVADGLGGYNAGDVASALAVKTIEESYPEIRKDPERAIKRTLETANARIYKQSLQNRESAGMGTTCTVLLIQGGFAYSAHVGDSRLYLLRDGGIYLMSEDHSQVMDMVRSGLLELSEVRHHPDKNVITRALGRQPEVEVSTWLQPLPLRVGDGFVVCSDGLYDDIEDNEICDAVQGRSASSACAELVRLAKERGGSDNITIAVGRLLPARPPLKSNATRKVEALP